MEDWKTELLSGICAVENAVGLFRERVRSFYFNVMSSKYRCPNCQDRFQIIGPSHARCGCGTTFDPTIEFQRSSCCSAPLVKKYHHYACSVCGSFVPSAFLFDEAIFDSEYFRERMRLCREKKWMEQSERRAVRLSERSGVLPLIVGVDLEAIPRLVMDLDRLVGADGSSTKPQVWGDALSLDVYRQHIINLVESEILFSCIEPLPLEERRDRIYRFITLIFMEHDHEVRLSQRGEDILVERR